MEYEKAADLRDRIQALESFYSQSEQNILHHTEELQDCDVWAAWPEENLEKSPVAIFSILQFRGGQWSGKLTRVAELEERIEGEDLMTSILYQHYTKNLCPQKIVGAPESVIKDPALTQALAELHAGDEGAAPEVSLHWATESKVFGEVWQLARQNARQAFEEKLREVEKREDVLMEVMKFLDLDHMPKHIECVDISNFQGEANVASCVVFRDGEPDKNLYRHYNIKSTHGGQDDFQSMRELMSRRFGKPDSTKPDLLIIDGGKGQLSSAFEVLKAMECLFPVVGLAKARTESNFQSEEVKSSQERIFFPGRKNHKKLSDGPVKNLLTRIRDEAHRFAIEFHRKKRDVLE
jgi:excinuclease ABC subunit C